MHRSITIFGSTRSLAYWVWLLVWLLVVSGISLYRKRRGLAGRFDYKMLGILVLLMLVLLVAWWFVMRNMHP